jgi:hypothetical protein
MHIRCFEEYILNESKIRVPKEFNSLYQYALLCDSAEVFVNKLNWNMLGHDRDNAFMGERFRRLNLGYRIDEDPEEWTTIYRTGDKPIIWGDYVYVDSEDAYNAYRSGQGNRVYSKKVKKGDISMCTQGSGEAFYSPRHLASFADDLYDFWYKTTGKPLVTQHVEPVIPIKATMKSDLEKLVNVYRNKANNSYVYNEFCGRLRELVLFHKAPKYNADKLWAEIQEYKKAQKK